MPVDPSIYNPLIQQQKSPLDYADAYNQMQLKGQQIQQNALALQNAAAVNQQKNALRAGIQSGSIDLSTPGGQQQALGMAPDVAPALLKTVQEGQTSAAQAANFNASAGKTNLETQVAKANKAISDITSLGSPQDAVTSIQTHLQNGDIDQGKFQTLMTTLQPVLNGQVPFGQWQRQMVLGIMDAKDRIAATAPKVEMANAGGSLVPVNTNADAGPVGPVAGSAPIKTTVSPDTAAQVGAANYRAGLERQTQLQINGLDANGTPLPMGGQAQPAPGSPGTPGGPPGPPAPQVATSPYASLVDTIGQYKGPESVVLQRVPPAIKSLIMGAVMQQYPDYDPMLYTEHQSAMHSFAPGGNNGKTTQAMNVSIDHLGKFQTLADALNNGDNQTLNSVGNAISAWTGQPAPTNFAAAKNIVMDEVVKGVLGSAGGEGDRDKMAAVVSAANSPAQLSGAIKTITSLMAGRLQGVEQSYRASTGRTDFAAKYLTPAAQAALSGSSMSAPPTTGFKITHIDGQPQ